MASLSETDCATVRTPLPPPAAPFPADRGRLVAQSKRLFLLLALAALLLLHLSNPSAWDDSPGVWAPAAGLGFILIAWFGPRAAWLVLAAGLLAALKTVLTAVAAGRIDASLLALATAEAFLGTAEALTAWWAYRRLGGARALTDPRSAVVFIMVVPGLTAAVFAAARAALACAVLQEWGSSGPLFAQIWLDRSLGLLTLAPPLLTAATPWLVRRGWVRPEVVREKQAAAVGHAGADRLTRGDAIEIAGLALGAGLLSLMLALTYLRPGVEGWQPWGAPLLLIVWASLRQGQRGGVLAAGVAAALPLCVLGALHGAPLIQGNLLALAAAGVLAAAAAGWVRINEMRYRQVVTHVPVVVYSAQLGPGGQAEVTLVSAASGDLFGRPADQLLGDHRRWLDRAHADDREVLAAALAQLSRQKQPVVCEYRLAPPAPEKDCVHAPSETLGRRENPPAARQQTTRIKPRWVRDVLAPQFDAEGRLAGWDGVVTEVTEQRALAVDLRRVTGMFHALVSNLPAGVFFVQGPSGQPILVNNRARELLGRREDTVAGLEHFPALYHLCRIDGSAYPAEELPVHKALRHGAPAMCDDLVVHQPDGRRVPLVTWAAPVRLGGAGEPDAAVWVLEDLTALRQAEAARRQLEEDLQHSQRLELVGQLSCGVAHDFNNLLTVVLGLADAAHGSLPPDHPAHDDLRRIAEAGEQAAGLAGQLLAFSRPQPAAARRADVNGAAKRTLGLLHAALPPAVRLEEELEAGDAPAPIDETQLQQVLMNLCLNARDAMPNGGRLRVRTETVADPGAPGIPWVRLSVADEGCGIPDDVKARMFEAFFTTKERGTGLGLAVVRQIVEGCGGRVEVQSEPGHGSHFDVWLPTQAADAGGSSTQAPDGGVYSI